jgi:hypothetical protein
MLIERRLNDTSFAGFGPWSWKAAVIGSDSFLFRPSQ